MPAKSQKQQKFMGQVYAFKKGKLKHASAAVKKAAKGMSTKEAKKFAKTKRKGLPVRVNENMEHFLTHTVGLSPSMQRHLQDEDMDAVAGHMDNYEMASPEEKKQMRMDIHDMAASRIQGGHEEDDMGQDDMGQDMDQHDDDEMRASEPSAHDYDHSEEDVDDEDMDYEDDMDREDVGDEGDNVRAGEEMGEGVKLSVKYSKDLGEWIAEYGGDVIKLGQHKNRKSATVKAKKLLRTEQSATLEAIKEMSFTDFLIEGHKVAKVGLKYRNKWRGFKSVRVRESVELKEGKKKPSSGLSKKKKSAVAKKAKEGKDIGKKGKNFEKVAKKAAKKYGSKEAGERVAAAAMWKNIRRG